MNINPIPASLSGLHCAASQIMRNSQDHSLGELADIDATKKEQMEMRNIQVVRHVQEACTNVSVSSNTGSLWINDVNYVASPSRHNYVYL